MARMCTNDFTYEKERKRRRASKVAIIHFSILHSFDLISCTPQLIQKNNIKYCNKSERIFLFLIKMRQTFKERDLGHFHAIHCTIFFITRIMFCYTFRESEWRFHICCTHSVKALSKKNYRELCI